jgi:hypothetical protein
LTFEFEPDGEVSSIEDAIPRGGKAGYLVESRPPQPNVLDGEFHGAILPQAAQGLIVERHSRFRTRVPLAHRNVVIMARYLRTIEPSQAGIFWSASKMARTVEYATMAFVAADAADPLPTWFYRAK